MRISSSEVTRGGFAFDRGAGGEDQFSTQATPLDPPDCLPARRPEVGQAKLLGAYAVERRERAVEHVIDAVVAAGLLDGGDVGGLFDDADQALVAGGLRAVDAGIDVGDVVADGAEAELSLRARMAVGERSGIGFAGAQDVEGEALRGLACPRRAACGVLR